MMSRMGRGLSCGQMGPIITENTKKARKMGMEFTFGLMGLNMKGSG